MMELSYYPGCSLESSTKEYDKSTRGVFKELGFELKEIEDWNCCGAMEFTALNPLLSIALPARNIVKAAEKSDKLVVACNACLNNLVKVKNKLETDESLKEKINNLLPGKFRPIEIKHTLDILVNDVGLDKIKEKVKMPLKGLKVASYYGCLIVRPSNLIKFDDPDNPQSLEHIVTTLGGESIEHSKKTKCCGGGLILTHEDMVLSLVKDILLEINEFEPDCIIVTCPLCYIALETIQPKIKSHYKNKTEIPILFFTQLIGLAMGIKPRELGCHLNLSSPDKIIKKIRG